MPVRNCHLSCYVIIFFSNLTQNEILLCKRYQLNIFFSKNYFINWKSYPTVNTQCGYLMSCHCVVKRYEALMSSILYKLFGWDINFLGDWCMSPKPLLVQMSVKELNRQRAKLEHDDGDFLLTNGVQKYTFHPCVAMHFPLSVTFWVNEICATIEKLLSRKRELRGNPQGQHLTNIFRYSLQILLFTWPKKCGIDYQHYWDGRYFSSRRWHTKLNVNKTKSSSSEHLHFYTSFPGAKIELFNVHSTVQSTIPAHL